MKLRFHVLTFLSLSFINALLAVAPSSIQTKDGVIVFTDPVFTGTSKAVKPEVVSDNIIRIITAPGKKIAASQSLLTVYAKRPDLFWNVVSTKETLTLKTKKLAAIVDLKTGAISFRDNSGKKILIKKPTGGRNFEPAIFDGRRHYHLSQTFQSTEDIRPFHQLGAMQLFSKKNEAGWLTASYANDKPPQELITQRAETSINMEFLEESKIQLPKEFTT